MGEQRKWESFKLPVMMEFVPTGDGGYRARPIGPTCHDPIYTVAQASKVLGIDAQGVRALYESNFIKGYNPTPGKLVLYVVSVLAHKQATESPEFWKKNRHLFIRPARR